MRRPPPFWRAQKADNATRVRLLWSGFLKQIGRATYVQDSRAGSTRPGASPRYPLHVFPEARMLFGKFKAFEAPGVALQSGGRSLLGDLESYDAFLSPVSEGKSPHRRR